MDQKAYRLGGKAVVAAGGAVTATYVYFLIFAQWGFLQALRTAVGTDSGLIRPVMAVMGCSGIAGSWLASRFFAVNRSRTLLASGFVVCAAAAGWSLQATAACDFFAGAALVGFGAGLTTVTLASVLCRVLGDRKLGTTIGFGTGLAYGFCNLPVIFEAGASTQTALALLAAGVGLAAVPFLALEESPPPAGYDYSRLGVAIWVLLFLALVSLDSAAFSVIQHTPALKTEMWTGAGRLEVNAGLHFGAAVLAGWALDRGWIGRTILAGAAALLLACGLIDPAFCAYASSAICYPIGVSVYSTVLVFYPARSLRPALAALVYAVAGWGGSAFGIGLAENRSTVPGWFLLGTGAMGLVALVVRQIRRGQWLDDKG